MRHILVFDVRMLDGESFGEELNLPYKRESRFTKRLTVPITPEQRAWLDSLQSRGIYINEMVRGLIDLARPAIEKKLQGKI